MNQLLEEKHLDVSRGYHYRYYISPVSQADTTKPALLLCHGWPDSALLWQYVVPYLLRETKLRLVVPDLLGYGGTSKPTDPKDFEIRGMVMDVMEVLEVENVASKIIPMGHDWGAYLASRIYMLHAPLMAGLITLNVALMPPQTRPYDLEANNAALTNLIGYPPWAYWTLFADPQGPDLMDQRLDSLWHALHGAPENWMRRLFCTPGAIREWISDDRRDVELKPYARVDGGLGREWREQAIPGGLRSPCCWYRAMKGDVQLETERGLEGGRLEAPYLFVGCDGDAVCRSEFIENAKRLGLIAGELEVHELHSGHWCPYEKPEEVAGLAVAWLRKHGFCA